MAQKVLNDYYIKRKPRLMIDFSKDLELARDILKRKFEDAKVDEIFIQMKSEYEKLIPEIPYIGGNKNFLNNLLVSGISSLSMFRVLEKEGFTIRDIGEFYYELCDIENTIRKNGLEKSGKDPGNYPFELDYVEFWKKHCETLNQKSYPDDWVGEFVEGDGKTFEWGFNFYECGIQKVFKRLNAEKYGPILCIGDFSNANVLGYGFSRSQSIGFGAPMCDPRYVKNYKTPRGWPPDELPEFNKKVMPKI